MLNRYRGRAARVLAVALAVAVLPACSVSIGAKAIEARASLFAPLNRETRAGVEEAEAERAIVAGLVAEDAGKTDLARAYLTARGYSAAEVDRRIAVVQAAMGRAAVAAAVSR